MAVRVDDTLRLRLILEAGKSQTMQIRLALDLFLINGSHRGRPFKNVNNYPTQISQTRRASDVHRDGCDTPRGPRHLLMNGWCLALIRSVQRDRENCAGPTVCRDTRGRPRYAIERITSSQESVELETSRYSVVTDCLAEACT